jgi:hypothetical protein
MTHTPLSSLQSLRNWISENGYSGYDPYDIKGHPLILRLTRLGNRNYMASLLREIIFEFFYTFPVASRRMLHIKPAWNAKAMGLFAASYIDLYTMQQDEKCLDPMRFCLNWLKNNKIKATRGIGWGYPFDWQSQMLIPAGTPNGIVTTAVGEAFWMHYRQFGDLESLMYCKEICEFLIQLPVDHLDEDRICFSYTPLFLNHVHNLNLFVAEFLIKIGMETGNTTWVYAGNKAVNYTIAHQAVTGEFDYNGPPEKPLCHFDNYHTGFVLRMLYSIWKLTGREDVQVALQKGYQHYITHFFEDGRIPKLMPDKKYRIDIHSCAESINCLSTLSPEYPEGLRLSEKVLLWTIENLQDKSGYFYYGILKSRLIGLTFKSKIPYIRWSQAWMLRAISKYLLILKQSHN